MSQKEQRSLCFEQPRHKLTVVGTRSCVERTGPKRVTNVSRYGLWSTRLRSGTGKFSIEYLSGGCATGPKGPRMASPGISGTKSRFEANQRMRPANGNSV